MIDLTPAAERDLEAIYARLDEALEPYLRPCEATGRCCRFARSEHMLFVTGLEAAYMLRGGQPLDPDQLAEGSCPFLRETRCGIRKHRALGCRIYFCDRTGEEERNTLYEDHLRAIRKLEIRHGIAHSYGPVTKAFAE